MVHPIEHNKKISLIFAIEITLRYLFKNKNLCFFILLGWSIHGNTQKSIDVVDASHLWLFGQATTFSESIATDRPTFSLGARTIPKGRMQFETGYTFSSDNENSGITMHTFPETLVRIGLTDTLEMRVEWPTHVFIRNKTRVSGMKDLVLGFKAQVFQQDRWRPQISIANRLLIPTGNKNLSSNHVESEVQMILSYTLNERISVFGNANAGSASSQDKRFAQFSSSLGLNLNYNNTLSGFIEYFGFYPISSSTQNIYFLQTGIMYQVNRHLQLDTRIGTGLNREANDIFIGAGLSWRF